MSQPTQELGKGSSGIDSLTFLEGWVETTTQAFPLPAKSLSTHLREL